MGPPGSSPGSGKIFPGSSRSFAALDAVPVELQSVDLIQREPGERVFRHGVIGPMVMWALFVLPVPLAVHLRAELAQAARSVPWPAWFVIVPMALVCGGLWLLVVQAVGQVAYRAMLPSNWLLRVSPAGLVVNLRSYQNAHFPYDGPTVARFPWAELRGARKVVERSSRRGPGGRTTLERKSWLELELAGVETAALERLIAAERARKGPERTFLGMRGSSRSNHVPVFVDRPGVLRLDWVGRGALHALGDHLELGERRTLDLDQQPGDVETRLRTLLTRGNRMAAHELARNELGLSLTQARKRLEELERRAA